MKNIAIIVLIGAAIWGLNSCGFTINSKDTPESTFLAEFSLGPVIEGQTELLIARNDLSSSSVADRTAGFYQKEETAEVQIEPENISPFIFAVRSEIEDNLQSWGAEIVGSGVGGLQKAPGYSIRYTLDGKNGVVNLFGVQGDGTNFYLLMLITEG